MTKDVTWEDLKVMAQTIWGEARGETQMGREAVAWVIKNRWMAESGQWKRDKTLAGTCLRAWQFSCWNEGDPNKAKMEALTPTDPTFRECLQAALAALNGVSDPVKGARHYKRTDLAWPKSWGPEQLPIISIGHHSFFVGID